MRLARISGIARGTLLALACTTAILAMGEVIAASSDCYAIKDEDKRAYCLAVVKRDYGYCHRIKDGDKRNQCMAEIKGTRSNCYTIKELDARKACLTLTIEKR